MIPHASTPAAETSLWTRRITMVSVGVAVFLLAIKAFAWGASGSVSILGAMEPEEGTALQAIVDELINAGTPTFIFTNGTDRVPTELERVGLSHLVPVLLNSHTLGFAKPTPEAFAGAHAEIESRLGRAVGRAEVHFTDDNPANVDAARVFGWQARVFTRPPDGAV